MRERSTWNRDQIVRTATVGKQAEDPRAMNQDHLQQQPAADAYVTGGPSEFGEDVHPSAGTWKAEYKGDEVARNEIGLPQMRGDTFSHPEKTAAMDDEAILKKADLCTKVARKMLKNASDAAIEEQALAFMHLPDAALIDTANRLATVTADDDEEQGQEQGQNQQKQAQQEDKDQGQDDKDQGQDDKDQGQNQQKQAQDDKKQGQQDEKKQGQQDDEKQGKKMSGEMPPQFRENAEKKKEEAKDKKDDDKGQGQNKGQQKQGAGDLFVAAIKAGNGQGVEQALSAMITQAFQQLSQGQQQPMSQTQPDAATAVQGQGQQQPMAQGQQQPMAQTQQMSDDQLLDQMLQDEMGQGQNQDQFGQPQMMAAAEGGDIQLEANTMDVGEVSLEAQDDVLNTLFASNSEYQNAAEAHALQNGGVRPTVTAAAAQPMTRTAATRTVGTRPTGGVSQIGGAGSNPTGGNEVDKLSGLWASAPDVSNVFR